MRPTRAGSLALAFTAMALILLISPRARGQFLVDCSGNTPDAYSTINSVLPLLSDGAAVRISGPCTENVTINGLRNLWIGTDWGQTASLQGNLTINEVHNLFLHGMNITNPSGNGINITDSVGVKLDACSSSNNANMGMNIRNSVVYIQDTGSFDNNGNYGVYATGTGNLQFNGYGGPISISDNLGDGIALQDGNMSTLGNMIISNNKPYPPNTMGYGSNGSGFGINLWGHARGVLWGIFAPDLISGNQAGGVAVHEGSEISISGPVEITPGVPIGHVIDGNGPVGVSVGMGSQATIWNGVQIAHHTDAAVDVFQKSQVFIVGNFIITNNGTGPATPNLAHAGIRVDGNSEAYIRGGQISQNLGAGILALVNSSIDLSGATLTSNLGGPIVCDSSAWLVTDLTLVRPSGITCNAPRTFTIRPLVSSTPPLRITDVSEMKAEQARYRQLIKSF